MRKLGEDVLPRGPRGDELVVAVRDGRIEAYALPVPCGDGDACVTVAERRGAVGMGRMALKHLMEQGTVRAVREERRSGGRPAAISRGEEQVCGLPPRAMRAVRI
jgi:hypothetical protein